MDGSTDRKPEPTLARSASLIVLVATILFLVVLFYRVMAVFLLPLFLAVILVVIFRPLFDWVLVRVRGRRRLAALATTAAILLIVLLPLGVIGTQATVEMVQLVTRLGEPAGGPGDDAIDLGAKLARLRERLGLDLPYADEIQGVEAALESLLESAEPPLAPEAIDEMALPIEPALEELEKSIAAHPEELPARAGAEAVHDQVDVIRRYVHAALDAYRAGRLEDFAARMEGARRELAELRALVSGGPFQAFLKDLANPGERRLREYRRAAFDLVQPWLLPLTRTTAAFALGLILWVAIMVLAVYYFFVDGPVMVRTVMRLSPLDDRYEQQLVSDFDTISRAVVVATLLSAVVQGILAALGFYFAGLGAVFFLMALTMLFALIPFVGAAAVWIPVCLWVFLIEGRILAAALLAAYSLLVVSTSDNVIKPFILHGRSNIHPLLALISILGGVSALGPIGILVGPMIVAFLHALLNMLRRELAGLEPQPVAKGKES